jgi:TfoX/Sxy family transcriptional regulator of competence genes
MVSDTGRGPTVRSDCAAREYDHCAMAYDEELADRVRKLVADERALTEQKMFGGLAFLVGGNMAVGVSGQGGLLVRVDPAESDELVESTPAYLMEMRGRQMRGWLRVDADHVQTPQALATWVERGVSFARSLPAK